MKKRMSQLSYKRLLALVLVFIFLGYAVDIGRLFHLQIIKGDEYAEKAQAQQLSDTEVTAMRGTIYDSDMNVIAKSASAWRLFIDPQAINDENERTVLVDGLSEILGYDEEEKQELLEKSKKENRYQVVENK